MRHVQDFSHDHDSPQRMPYYFSNDLVFFKAFVVEMRKESPTRTNSYINKEISLFQNLQTGSGYHPASCSIRTEGVLSQRVKRPGFQGDQLLNLRMRGAIPLLPHMPSWSAKVQLCLYSYMQKYEPTQMCLK
jgi:hypothetical protein